VFRDLERRVDLAALAARDNHDPVNAAVIDLRIRVVMATVDQFNGGTFTTRAGTPRNFIHVFLVDWGFLKVRIRAERAT